MRLTSLPPIYEEMGEIYLVDSNEPQRRAIREGKVRCRAYTHGAYLGDPLVEGELPGVSAMGCLDIPATQDWVMDMHRNEGVEICWLEAGAMTMAVEGTRYPLRAGELTVTRPWQLHRHGDPVLPAGRLHWVILDVGVRRPNQPWTWPPWVVLTPADREELTWRLRGNSAPVLPGSRSVQDAFQRMGRALAEHPLPISRMTLCLNEVLLSLLDGLRRSDRSSDREISYARETVELFLRDLKQNPASLAQPWTLPAMASKCGMGVTAFCKWCRMLTNASPLAYLGQCRMEWAAARLLDAPGESITEIAMRCGYNSSQYFATAFKRHTNLSPRTWRKRLA